MVRFAAGAAILGLMGTTGAALAQDEGKAWKYPGFLALTGQLYQTKPHAGDARALADFQGQIGIQGAIRRWLSLHGRWDFRVDSHTDVDEGRWLDVDQRGLRPPAGALGELYLDFPLGRLDLRAGTQEVHWGRADGFNPTDNINPYDYSYPFSGKRLAVPALSAEAALGRASLQGVWVPFFTPTRLPLLDKRWYPRLPRSAPLGPPEQPVTVDVVYLEGLRAFPARAWANGQWGVRWNQLLPGGEFSLSYLYAFNDIGSFHTTSGVRLRGDAPELVVVLHRDYFRVGILGFDFAADLGPIGLRGEMALFDETDPDDLDRLVYIVELDRRWKDWFVIVQYTDWVGKDRPATTPLFPDLGFRSTLSSRIERTIGPFQTLELTAALRLRDGDSLLQLLYSVALKDTLRLKIGADLISGPPTGYLGQYRGNDHLTVELRYSF